MRAALQISKAANLLGVSIKTIRCWHHAGLIDCFRTVGAKHQRQQELSNLVNYLLDVAGFYGCVTIVLENLGSY